METALPFVPEVLAVFGEILNIRYLKLLLEMLVFLEEDRTGIPGEQPFGARQRTNNNLNPHMALTPGFEPEPDRLL